MPPSPLKIMMNVGNPERAFDFADAAQRAASGLARLEFIVKRIIGVHPQGAPRVRAAGCRTSKAADRRAHGRLYRPGRLLRGQASPKASRTIAAAFAPKPVIVRLSDFKSNEYANLIGGSRYEPHEEKPMLGFRGAARYVDQSFRAGLRARVPRAEARARAAWASPTVQVMIPFVRTLRKRRKVTELLAENGLEPRRERPQGHHDVRAAVQRAAGRRVPRASSTAARSAPTT
jgi:pyruvate,water dikinase